MYKTILFLGALALLAIMEIGVTKMAYALEVDNTPITSPKDITEEERFNVLEIADKTLTCSVVLRNSFSVADVFPGLETAEGKPIRMSIHQYAHLVKMQAFDMYRVFDDTITDETLENIVASKNTSFISFSPEDKTMMLEICGELLSDEEHDHSHSDES
jgi:hypothetical protein